MSDWQLDRLPLDVRHEAETAAQREGLPLHRWLGKLIRETCADEGIPPGPELRRVTASAARRGSNGEEPTAARPPAEPVRSAVPPLKPVERPSADAKSGDGGGETGARRTPTIGPPPVPPAPPPLRAASMSREASPNEPPPPATASQQTPTSSPPSSSAFSRLAAGSAPLTPAKPGVTTVRNGAPPPPADRAGMSRDPAPTERAATRPVAETPATAPTPPRQPAPATAADPSPVPAALRPDNRLAALSKLVHSLRRNELSPIGEARLFLKLMTEHAASIGDITIATGRTKEQVTRSLRLLGLSDRLRDLIDRGALSREQAFALLDTDDPEASDPVVPPSAGYRKQ